MESDCAGQVAAPAWRLVNNRYLNESLNCGRVAAVCRSQAKRSACASQAEDAQQVALPAPPTQPQLLQDRLGPAHSFQAGMGGEAAASVSPWPCNALATGPLCKPCAGHQLPHACSLHCRDYPSLNFPIPCASSRPRKCGALWCPPPGWPSLPHPPSWPACLHLLMRCLWACSSSTTSTGEPNLAKCVSVCCCAPAPHADLEARLPSGQLERTYIQPLCPACLAATSSSRCACVAASPPPSPCGSWPPCSASTTAGCRQGAGVFP